MKRAEPIVRVRKIYDHAWSRYPDRVKIPMDDGKVIEYQILIPMPEPVLGQMLNRFERKYLGYRFKKRKHKEENSNG